MKDKLIIIGGVLLGILLIAWFIAEMCGTRTFTGRLNSKCAETWYTYDEERTTFSTDADGNITTHTVGSDETVAHINYRLNFYSEGKIRSVSAGHYSARVGHLHAERMAMDRLMRTHTVPAHYTYTREGQEYLVDVRGWLVDGTVRDITLLSLVPGEKAP